MNDTPPPPAPRSTPPPKADIVIVGGGVYGAATAWELARRGVDVALFEAHTIAAGASGGLGKRGVRANGRDLRELPLMRAAYERWPTLSGELGADTGYERTGHLLLYERHHDIGAAGVRARIQEEAGIPTRHLSGEALREIEPGLAAGVIGGLHAPLDGVADHGETTRAYARAAARAGAAIHEQAPVVEIMRRHELATAVRLADGSTVEVGRQVIVLANGGLEALFERSFGLALPIWTVFPQVVRSSPAPQPPFRSLVGHVHRPVALKMIADGSVMLSGGWRGRWNAALSRGDTTPASVAGNWAEAIAVFPAIAALEIAEAVADRAETTCVDGVPFVDRVPGAANVLVAAGWSGHGWAIAPAVAPLLAQWTLDGEAPEALRPFSAARFAAVATSSSPYAGWARATARG